MTVVFFIISMYVVYKLIKEKSENKRPANLPDGYEIDWSRMSNDLMNGKSKKQVKNDCKNGGYLRKE